MALRWGTDMGGEALDEGWGSLLSGLTLDIYTGTKPTNLQDGPGSTLLASISIPDPGFNDADESGGPPIPMTKTGTWQAVAGADGDAGWFRIFSPGLSIVYVDGTISATGGGGDLELDDVSIVSGATVTINTFTLKCPLANGDVEISDALAAVILQVAADTAVEDEAEAFDRLAIFDGSVPASANDSTAATKLAEIDLDFASLWSRSNNVLTKDANNDWQATIDADGTAAFFRFYQSAAGDDGVSAVGDTVDRERLQGTITATGGGGVLELDSTSLVSGGTIVIDSFTITYPTQGV